MHRKNQRTESRADFRNWIKSSGKQWLSLWRTATAGLSFTNCSLALHHCPLEFGAKTTLVERIWQKNNNNNNIQTSKQKFLALFCPKYFRFQPVNQLLAGSPVLWLFPQQMGEFMEVCKCGRHTLCGGTKRAGCTKMAPEQKQWNACGVVIKSTGTSSVLHTSRREPCMCVCEHVKESAWRSFNVPVVLFPTEQTWRSSRTNTGGSLLSSVRVQARVWFKSHQNSSDIVRPQEWTRDLSVCPLVADTRAPPVDSWGHVGCELLFVPLFHCETFDGIRMRGVLETRLMFWAVLHESFLSCIYTMMGYIAPSPSSPA